jgi:hypothetical protein
VPPGITYPTRSSGARSASRSRSASCSGRASIGGWAAAYYFGTDPALAPRTATALIDRINDDTAHVLAIPIGGALLVGLGTLMLAVALWRARTVPRWVPIGGALAAVATILIPPDTVAGIVSEGASSATTIAIGWYAWRR